MRVLVVDDDPELLGLVQKALERDDHAVWTSASAEHALEVVRTVSPEIVLVDLGLPLMSGEELTRELRSLNAPPAILILTAQSAVSSRVRCLDAGADDYLAKPFAIAELRARVRALSRRVSTRTPPQNLTWGDVEIDFSARKATREGKDAPITAREWAILEILAGRRGQVITRKELIERVWNQAETEGTVASLEVLMGRIRRKLAPDLIGTARGQGYRLEQGKNS